MRKALTILILLFSVLSFYGTPVSEDGQPQGLNTTLPTLTIEASCISADGGIATEKMSTPAPTVVPSEVRAEFSRIHLKKSNSSLLLYFFNIERYLEGISQPCALIAFLPLPQKNNYIKLNTLRI